MPSPMRRSCGAVGPRIVHQVRVVQRELARLHRHERRARAVDVGRQRLAARQQVLGVLHVGVRQLAELVRARHDLHAARFDRRVGQRHPGGDVADRIEREVGRILVPAHIGAGAGDPSARP